MEFRDRSSADHTMDLVPEVLRDRKLCDSTADYRLRAVVLYALGHYVSAVRTSESVWVLVDDARVSFFVSWASLRAQKVSHLISVIVPWNG